MAYGVDNQIGIGKAQVLPKGASLNAFVNQLNERKQYNDRQKRYDQDKKDSDELNKLKIIGDVLDPRNFNQLVHGELRTATSDLAKQLKGKTVTDTYQLAQQYAGQIGYMSDQFTQLQDKLSKEREQYKSNKRINTNAAAEDALQEGITQFRKNGKVDLNSISLTNTFNKNPSRALVGGAGYSHDVNPDELTDYNSKYQYKDSKLGGKTFGYSFKNFPIYYQVDENGKTETPTVTTRSEGSVKIGDVEKPKLEKNAYERYKLDEANIIGLNKRIQDRYPNIDLEGEQAEEYRMALAFEDVDKMKPIPKRNEVVADTRQPISTFNFFGSDFTGKGQTTGNELDRIKENIKLPSDDYTGEWTATGAHIPKLTRAVLKSGGVEIGDGKKIRLVYSGGELQEIRSIDGKTLIANRDDMIVAQKKYDAERKGEGQKFGEDKNKPTDKKRVYKGLDKNGNPIFE
jgi:hypothetical protein